MDLVTRLLTGSGPGLDGFPGAAVDADSNLYVATWGGTWWYDPVGCTRPISVGRGGLYSVRPYGRGCGQRWALIVGPGRSRRPCLNRFGGVAGVSRLRSRVRYIRYADDFSLAGRVLTFPAVAWSPAMYSSPSREGYLNGTISEYRVCATFLSLANSTDYHFCCRQWNRHVDLQDRWVVSRQ